MTYLIVAGAKNPGLMILEHELSDQTVQAFMDNYPKIKSNGWQTASLARVVNGSDPYQNVHGDQVAPASVYLINGTMARPTSSSASSRFVLAVCTFAIKSDCLLI